MHETVFDFCLHLMFPPLTGLRTVTKKAKPQHDDQVRFPLTEVGTREIGTLEIRGFPSVFDVALTNSTLGLTDGDGLDIRARWVGYPFQGSSHMVSIKRHSCEPITRQLVDTEHPGPCFQKHVPKSPENRGNPVKTQVFNDKKPSFSPESRTPTLS